MEKSQAVRLIDVLVLGPFLIWAGHQRQLPSWGRDTLNAIGVLTITYNLRNYLETRRADGSRRID